MKLIKLAIAFLIATLHGQAQQDQVDIQFQPHINMATFTYKMQQVGNEVLQPVTVTTDEHERLSNEIALCKIDSEENTVAWAKMYQSLDKTAELASLTQMFVTVTGYTLQERAPNVLMILASLSSIGCLMGFLDCISEQTQHSTIPQYMNPNMNLLFNLMFTASLLTYVAIQNDAAYCFCLAANCYELTYLMGQANEYAKNVCVQKGIHACLVREKKRREDLLSLATEALQVCIKSLKGSHKPSPLTKKRWRFFN